MKKRHSYFWAEVAPSESELYVVGEHSLARSMNIMDGGREKSEGKGRILSEGEERGQRR